MKKVTKFLGIALAAVVLQLAGCGNSDVLSPQGVYTNNNNESLDFSESKVTITEGYSSTTLSYTADEAGNIIIDPEGEDISASYDAEADVVTIYGTKYKKSGTSDSGEVINETVDMNEVISDGNQTETYNEDMFDYEGFFRCVDGTIEYLYLREPGHAYGGDVGHVTVTRQGQQEGEVEYVERYAEMKAASGNSVTVIMENGTEKTWNYDEATQTMTSGNDCFYSMENVEAYVDDMISKSDKVIEGNYTGIYSGSWTVGYGTLKEADRTVVVTFSADHTLDSVLDIDYSFIYGKYFFEGDNIYLYAPDDGGLFCGTYDESQDMLELAGVFNLTLKRAEE